MRIPILRNLSSLLSKVNSKFKLQPAACFVFLDKFLIDKSLSPTSVRSVLIYEDRTMLHCFLTPVKCKKKIALTSLCAWIRCLLIAVFTIIFTVPSFRHTYAVGSMIITSEFSASLAKKNPRHTSASCSRFHLGKYVKWNEIWKLYKTC
jgi:hypothetical protein